MRVLIFVILWLLSCGFALWRGGRPERVVAATFLIGGPASAIAASAFATRFNGFELGLFLVDVAMFVTITAVALKAYRLWPIPVAALQLLQVTSHVLKIADPELFPLLYWVTNIGWAYPMLILLVLGTILLIRRQAAHGRQRDWSVRTA